MRERKFHRMKQLWEKQSKEIKQQYQKLHFNLQNEKAQNEALQAFLNQQVTNHSTHTALDMKVEVQFRNNLIRALDNQRIKIGKIEEHLVKLNSMYMNYHQKIESISKIIKKNTQQELNESMKKEIKNMEALYLQYKQHQPK